jgi:hypothetical protein
MLVPIELVAFCGGVVFGVVALVGLVWLAATYQRRPKR